VRYGLGVDLGTTYTAAAVHVDGRADVAHLGGRRPEIPSLVFVRGDGEVLVGEAAERRGGPEPGRLAREFKRRVGDPVPILVGGAPYSAHALTARLLAEVHAIVVRQQEEPPAEITVTHPANWGPYKRELLGQAIQLAELEGVRLRPEPEAAAVQYAASERVQPDEVVAVYDLGGGTFDAAVLRKTGSGFALLGEPEGIEQLGGIDFDEAVFGHVVATLGSHVTDLDPDDDEATAALARLRRDCVEAKEGLSFDTEVMIPIALPGLHTRVRLNRSEFEAMISPALSDTIAAMRRALRSAGIAPEELRSVLLAGGSSRIPLVGQLLGTEFGRPVVLDPHPEHTIALGAARLTAAPDASEATTVAFTRPSAAPAPAAPVPPPAPPAPDEAAEPVTVAYVPGPPVGADATAEIAAAAPEPAPQPAAKADPAPKSPLWSPSKPRWPGLVSRRTLLVAVPSLAVLGAGVGAVAAAVADSSEDNGAGPGPGQSPSSQATPSQPSASPAAAGLDAPMLVRLDQGGNWPSTKRSAIYRAVPGTGERTPLADGGYDILPRWSPDRSKIAFIRRTGSKWQVWTMNADGTDAAPVTDRVKPTTRVGWSPDGRRIAFLSEVKGKPQLFAITLGASTPVQLTNTGEPKDDLSWSPADELIAIKATRGKQQQVFVCRSDQPGAAWRQVTTGNARAADPIWSPDGLRIAYTRSVPFGGKGLWTSHIWVVNADGTGARAITSGPSKDWDPTWSPDGTWIAFTRGQSEHPAIYCVRADGSDPRRLTAGNAQEGHPAWS
jgi:molecular chaperone DnaK